MSAKDDSQHALALGDAKALPEQSDRMPEALISQALPVVEIEKWEMDWHESEHIIIEQQLAIAVYRNPRDHVVIRQEAESGDPEDDPFIRLATDDAIRLLIAALQRELKNGS